VALSLGITLMFFVFHESAGKNNDDNDIKKKVD